MKIKEHDAGHMTKMAATPIYGKNRLESGPTFSYYSYFFVLFLLFSYFFLKVPTIPTLLLSNAKMMIGLRKSRDSMR